MSKLGRRGARKGAARGKRKSGRGRGAAHPFGPERRLALAASITSIGLAMVGIGASDVGASAVLIGLLFFGFAIHTYGRLGAEHPEA